MKPDEILAQVAAETAVCQKCPLHFSRKNAVVGEGPLDAEIMFIGEGPGFHENEQGRPFVGAAGKFLDELLGNIGMRREQVYITNVVKCRPPGNRDPQPEELAACSDYLERQLRTINPRLVVTLGRFSMARFLPNAKISAVHGQAVQVQGRWVVPLFHPAAALHQPSLKPMLEQDFSHLPELIKNSAQTSAPIDLRTSSPGTPPADDERYRSAAAAPVATLLPLFGENLKAAPSIPAEAENPPIKQEPKQLSLF